MSDQENEIDEPPKLKRKRLAKPFQPISLPTHTLEFQNSNINKKTSKSQNVNQISINNDDTDFFSLSIAGVIKKIKLVNFMCHSHFEINFNPRINFISGCNGSGKSAIQTAIAIGLGGSASKTNRSSKIDGLIKHGCNSGNIMVTLSNTGLNAYKPHEYGNEIQIVRNITTTSTYKIYNQWGKIMSTKKNDLENILLKFRIQPNNPVSILNQDMARNFLSTNKAESKYALFRKATLLDEAEEILMNISHEINEQEIRIETKQKAIQTIQEEIEKLSKKYELAQKLKESKEKKFELENEKLWSQINDKRNDLSNLKEIREQQKQIKDTVSEQIRQIEISIEMHVKQKKEYEITVANLQNENKTEEEHKKKLTEEYRRLRKSFEEKRSKYEETELKIKSKQSDITHLKKTLDDVERTEVEQKEKKQEAIVEAANLKEHLVDYESQIRILENELNRLKNTSDHFNQQLKDKERIIQENREQIGHCEKQIQNMIKPDNLSTYASWMPSLVQKINEAIKMNKFSKPPRGPIGRYLKVENKKWMYAIESNLGIGFLTSFYVNNSNDRHTLYNIMNQIITTGRKPTVHCSIFQEKKRDEILSKIETCHPQYINMFRALTISDTVVANFLIDYRNIQKILLVEKSEDCRYLVSRNENTPRNCAVILNLEADQYLPGFRVYANQDRSRLVRVLQKSAADHLKELNKEIILKNELISKQRIDLENTRQQYKHSNEKVQQMFVEITKIKSKVAETRRKIQELNITVEMETPSLQAQLEELKEIEQELKLLETSKETYKAEKYEDEKKLKQIKTQLNAVNSEDMLSQQTVLIEKKNKIEQIINELRHKSVTLAKKIEEQNTKINTLNTRIEDSQKILDNEQEQASQFSGVAECNNARPLSEILVNIDELTTFIAEAKKKIGEEEFNFEKDYWSKKKTHKTFLKLFNNLKELHMIFKKMYKEREDIIEKIRDNNANVIIAQFQTVLRSRNYKGRLSFDHEKRRLDILLAPTDDGSMYMNTESLSGGEKSFSTVAFLMALWSNMELPFYSMDEYDVFMDAINRKAITKLLMSFAQDKSNRQFIFLTPLDVSIITTGPHVKVHRIKKLQKQ